MSSIGKKIRLSQIFDSRTKRTVIIPMDDGLIDGAEKGLRHPISKVKEIVAGGADAILGFKGIIKLSHEHIEGKGILMNLTASSSLSFHTKKTLVANVEDALKLGLSGVAVHVNISSKYEAKMMKNLGTISSVCDEFGMPLMALMYPRTESENGDNNYLDIKENEPDEYAKLVRHASRIGVEIGADIIKTQYTGSPETFQTVVESCAGIPVLIAGGAKVSVEQALRNANGAVKAGAAGVCFGRNAFNRTDTSSFVKALTCIVHKGVDVEEAMRMLDHQPNLQ